MEAVALIDTCTRVAEGEERVMAAVGRELRVLGIGDHGARVVCGQLLAMFDYDDPRESSRLQEAFYEGRETGRNPFGGYLR